MSTTCGRPSRTLFTTSVATPAFPNLVHDIGSNAGAVEHVGGAAGRDQIEAHLGEVPRERNHGGLVAVLHRDEDRPVLRHGGPASELGFRESAGEIDVEPHGLAGRFHLRPENDVGAVESGERKDRLLDGDMAPLGAHGIATKRLIQALARHHAGRHLGNRDTGRLGDERHGAACPGVHLEDVDVAVLVYTMSFISITDPKKRDETVK